MMRLKTLLFALVCCMAQAQAQQPKTQGLVAFYNLENLFDTENDSTINDEEFLPGGANEWTEERYRQKLHQMATAISGMSPDILGLCEIENRRVVEDLVQQPELKANRYQVVHFDSPDRRGIDVALVYRPRVFVPFYTRAVPYNHPDDPDFATRDILYVKGLFNKADTLHLFVNHWPSRRGGKEENRLIAAQILRGQVDSILAINPMAKIIMMGDFNDDPANKSMKEILRAGMKDKKLEPGDLFNTSAPTFKQGYGTLGYQGVFNLFDQIVISQGLLQGNSKTFFYLPESYKIFATKDMQVAEGRDKGFPLRTFSRGVYNPNGFSDHYPAFILLGQ